MVWKWMVILLGSAWLCIPDGHALLCYKCRYHELITENTSTAPNPCETNGSVPVLACDASVVNRLIFSRVQPEEGAPDFSCFYIEFRVLTSAGYVRMVDLGCTYGVVNGTGICARIRPGYNSELKTCTICSTSLCTSHSATHFINNIMLSLILVIQICSCF